MRPPIGSLLGLALLTGCAEGHVFDAHGYPHGHFEGTVILAGRTPIHLSRWVPDEDDDDSAPARSASFPSRPPPPPNATRPDPPRRPFDATSALTAIHSVDLSTCGARTTIRTYGHARITLAPSGTVTGVLIDAPVDIPADAAACLEERLAFVAVPAFDGGAVTVGATYYLR